MWAISYRKPPTAPAQHMFGLCKPSDRARRQRRGNTTYGYDAFGARVLQTGTTTTFIYPSKFYSIASSTLSGAKYATTTSYIFNGDTLLSTIDQQFASGVATGSPQTLYIHPDHLGSTNIVTNASGTVVQTLDYYPFGATRINSGENTESRQYIGQFSDASGLLYLQARYAEPSRGQFLSQDPVFWEVGRAGVGRVILQDPQLLNSYSYAANNPISGKDADGRLVELVSRPLDVNGAGMFGHAFLKITPTNPSTIGSVQDVNFNTGAQNVVDTSKPFTLTGYTNGTVLYKEANAGPDYARMASCTGCGSVVIGAPQEDSGEDLKEILLAVLINCLKFSVTRMEEVSQVRFTRRSNSNNAVTTYLMQGGVSSQQINGYQSQLYGNNGVFVPGLGQSAFAPTYSQSARAQIGAILGQLASALQQISSVLSSMSSSKK